MAPKEEPDSLKMTEELFAFLQGNVPEGIRLGSDAIPTLGVEQAWAVIWYLGNLFWQVPDYIERCDVCGTLFNSRSDGACLDYGDIPYHFCEGCIESEEYIDKREAAGGDDD